MSLEVRALIRNLTEQNRRPLLKWYASQILVTKGLPHLSATCLRSSSIADVNCNSSCFSQRHWPFCWQKRKSKSNVISMIIHEHRYILWSSLQSITEKFPDNKKILAAVWPLTLLKSSRDKWPLVSGRHGTSTNRCVTGDFVYDVITFHLYHLLGRAAWKLQAQSTRQLQTCFRSADAGTWTSCIMRVAIVTLHGALLQAP